MIPTQPCEFKTGSDDRIACYRQRIERGLPLFHPEDSTETKTLTTHCGKQIDTGTGRMRTVRLPFRIEPERF